MLCQVNSAKENDWMGRKLNERSMIYPSHYRQMLTRFPLAGGSKRQGSVSHSTREAKIVAADVTLRTMGLPALSI